MRNKLPILLSFIALLFICPISVLAAGFQLKNVGELNVEGVTYDHLWYTSGNVTFSGTALAGAQVTATIDGVEKTVTADSSGNWSYTASLATGDHNVGFSSNESVIFFTLTIGEVPANVGTLPQATTPTVGTVFPTLILILVAGSLIISSLLVKKWLIAKG